MCPVKLKADRKWGGEWIMEEEKRREEEGDIKKKKKNDQMKSKITGNTSRKRHLKFKTT